MDGTATLAEWIRGAGNIAFFGGAGVSTESGIPDFRSADGLFSKKSAVPPEVILSAAYFSEHTAEFFDYYRTSMINPNARPNPAHTALARLEAMGKVGAVITQNIDGLHQAAGSKNVLELHGGVSRNTCLSCGARYGAERIISSAGIPHCECGGVIKPDVVLYGEPLNTSVFVAAERAIAVADVLIVAGTSLSVYPAAGLVDSYHGKKYAYINREHSAGGRPNLRIRGDIGRVLSEVMIALD